MRSHGLSLEPPGRLLAFSGSIISVSCGKGVPALMGNLGVEVGVKVGVEVLVRVGVIVGVDVSVDVRVVVGVDV